MEGEKKLNYEDEDCYVIEPDALDDHNTSAAIELSMLSISNNNVDTEELCIIAEKPGLVACRDYPHPRYLCAQSPFSTTPHQEHCQKCYCYVCEEVAPCKSWTDADRVGGHCHATNQDPKWKIERARKSAFVPPEPNQRANPPWSSAIHVLLGPLVDNDNGSEYDYNGYEDEDDSCPRDFESQDGCGIDFEPKG